MSQTREIRAAVVGASGYVGGELLRLLVGHPQVRVTVVAGRGNAGKRVADVLPGMRGVLDGEVQSFDADTVARDADLAFCALPHGASAPIVGALRERDLPVFDMSADYRLRDLSVYRQWYGEHGAPSWLEQAVYGLPELYRDALREAALVAVPGCFPTAAILAIAPLLRAGLVGTDSVIIDAKTGVSGAGRAASARTHFPETAEGVRAYKLGGAHRHTPEIEQELSALAGRDVRVSFTPHLVPMTRGILATCYLNATGDISAARCTEAANAFYEGSCSVSVLDPGSSPDTLWVRGSNRAHVAYETDVRTGRVLALCSIDNLVRGAAGQGVQCMNLRLGLPEDSGLQAGGMFP